MQPDVVAGRTKSFQTPFTYNTGNFLSPKLHLFHAPLPLAYSHFTHTRLSASDASAVAMSLQSAGRDSSRRVAARNPRRRQRLDTDSVGHQPQRKRSKVTSETFDAGTTTNGDRRRLSTAGLSADVRSRKSPTPNDILDVPLRPRRPADARAARSHTGAVLVRISMVRLAPVLNIV